MKREEKDKLSLYGKLVCDFANGDTTDKILSDYFKNLQSVFEFSKDFTQKALAQYQIKGMTVGTIPNQNGSHIFNLLRVTERAKGIRGDPITNDYNVKQYNPAKQMFTIEKRIRGKDAGTSNRIHLSEIGEYLDRINTPGIQKEIIIELANICHQTKKKQAINGFTLLEEIARDHHRVFDIQLSIGDTNKRLKGVLLQLTESDSPLQTKEFRTILSQYNSIPKIKCIVSDNMQLVDSSPFTEDYFIGDNSLQDDVYYFPHKKQGWQIFAQPTWYCFIELLKNPDYSGIERIAICLHCKHIFCKTKLYGEQRYCPICSRKNKMTREKRAAYQKEYRKNPIVKKATAEKRREEKIQHLMDNAGKTRKQAEIIVDGEV